MLGLFIVATGLVTGVEKRDSSGSITTTSSASWDTEWDSNTDDDWRRRWCVERRIQRGNGWKSDWYWNKCRSWDGEWMNSYQE